MNIDHVVYLDEKANELNNLLSGIKTMIIRGATGRKLPYGRVNIGDTLYFINNNAELLIKAKAQVVSVFNSEQMSENESKLLVNKYQDKLQLTDKQISKWAGKRYIVLIEVNNMTEISPFSIDKSDYSNMDDWLIVENIDNVRVK